MIETSSLVTDSPGIPISTVELIELLGRTIPLQYDKEHRARANESGVRTRHAVASLRELARLTTIEERNALYGRTAVTITDRIAREALDRAGVGPSAVDVCIVASSTGQMIPGLDRHLAARLALRSESQCLLLQGLGCAGAVRAIGLAADLLRVRGRGTALVVAVELPSIWLQLAEPTAADIESHMIFGDGAAAAVLSQSDTTMPQVIAHRCVQWPDSLTDRTAILSSTGLRHRTTGSRLLRLIGRNLPRTIRDFLSDTGFQRADLASVIVNASDRAVARAVGASLGLSDDGTTPSLEVLAEYGNTLSVGPLHCLRVLAMTTPPSDGALVLFVVLGPGVTCDLLLFRWRGGLRPAHYNSGPS